MADSLGMPGWAKGECTLLKVFFVKGRYFKVGVVWAEASGNSFMELWNFYQGSRILFPGQGTVSSGSRIFLTASGIF